MTEKEPNKFKKWFANANNILAIATFILAIFTAFSAFYTKNLAFDSRRQTDNTFKLLENNQKSVAIAESSLVASKDGIAIENSPFFKVDIAGDPRPQVDKKVFFNIIFTNIGKTPALDFHALVRYYFNPGEDIRPLGQMPPIPDHIINMKDVVNIGVIPPSGFFAANGGNTSVNQEGMNAIKYGGRKIVLRIIIWYSDIFHKNHLLVWRQNYIPEANVFSADEKENKYVRY